MAEPPPDKPHVLVSDFDGTMTRYDFYRLVIATLLPPNTPDYWSEYCAGRLTHFETLRRYFAAIRATEAEVLAVVDRLELDPQLPAAVQALRAAGWEVVVTSAGCSWYIERVLRAAGVSIEVHANPGRFVEGQGLLLEWPTDSPYFSPQLGIDKAAVVRRYLAEGRTVAFAGDGYPDIDAARLVPASGRFARDHLAEALTRAQLPFTPFRVWSDIARVLLQSPL
ncbi:MAG: MtnX-like HAD-IB family phosphatase [Gemmataceae bacterium]|nr:MtnX-like HAD-IB family phosphatase [Gemmata sp.]MDW8196859.1 MtnX-like HAD-IB family phosphatase [Gemmataceae bacterium]